MYFVTINFLSALSFSWTISMLFAGLSCAALSGAKPNSIAAARKVVVTFNTFMCMIASPCNGIHDNRRKGHGGGEAKTPNIEGTSDNRGYVAHGLALLNEIRTWCGVREGRCSKKGCFF